MLQVPWFLPANGVLCCWQGILEVVLIGEYSIYDAKQIGFLAFMHAIHEQTRGSTVRNLFSVLKAFQTLF